MKTLWVLIAISFGTLMGSIGEEQTILVKGTFTVRNWNNGDVTVSFSGTLENLDTGEVVEIENTDEVTIPKEGNENKDRNEEATEGLFKKIFNAVKGLFGKKAGSNVMADPETGEGDYRPFGGMSGSRDIPIIVFVGDPGSTSVVSEREMKNSRVLSYKDSDHFYSHFQQDMMPHLLEKR